MSTPAPVTSTFLSSLAFFKSKVFVGLIVSFVGGIVALFGRHLAPEVITEYVRDGLELLTTLATMYAMWKRWRSDVQPLTLSTTPALAAQVVVPVPVSAVPSNVLDSLGVTK
jgi:hypothetical protein